MGRVLVGRDAECAVLSRALAAAQRRPAPVVLVSGEAGAGKTTLVEHVLARVGTPMLSGRPAEWAGAAYDVLARALRPAVRDMAAPVSPVLAQIFPERAVPPATPDPAAPSRRTYGVDAESMPLSAQYRLPIAVALS